MKDYLLALSLTFAAALGCELHAAEDQSSFKPFAGVWHAKPFAGVWHAKPGVLLRQLTIQEDGSFRWLAQHGDARAEGDGQILKNGDVFFITIQFNQKRTMQITVVEKGAKLRLTEKDGTLIDLSLGGGL